MILIILYLFAIMVANLLVAAFGPEISILNEFLFIGLDLSTRDALHERWHGRELWPRMLLLVGVGSVISAALNWQATNIAIASFVAFSCLGLQTRLFIAPSTTEGDCSV